MTILGAFWGGFHSFFSIWLSCLMQVIPFLVAFLVGASIPDDPAEPARPAWDLIPLNASAVFGGFTALFVCVGMVTTGISKALFHYMEILNLAGGVAIALTGLYFAGLLTLMLSKRATAALHVTAGILTGAALGIAYKPCVTPTLTVIFSINTSPGNGAWGGTLLLFYSLGISAAVLIFGIPLAAYASKAKSAQTRLMIKKICGAVLLAVALLILTDKMTVYKSFLVGGFVSSEDGSGGGHHHEATPTESPMDDARHDHAGDGN